MGIFLALHVVPPTCDHILGLIPSRVMHCMQCWGHGEHHNWAEGVVGYLYIDADSYPNVNTILNRLVI